jgi:DNA repair protein RecN (Recombination protein N)
LSPSTQRNSLDQFGDVSTAELQAAREAVTHIDANLAALGGDEKSRVREIDLLQFQCDEIESSRIANPDEDVLLSNEEDMLTDVVRHQESLQKIVSLLSDEGAVVDLLGDAVSAIGPVTSLPALSERIRSLAAEAKDVSDTVRSAADGSEHDPARLEEIRLRRQSLRDLMRKYGDSLADVMAFGAEARERLDELTGYAERVAELEKSKVVALRHLSLCQKEVGNARRAAAPKLATAVQKRLRQLALPNATVQVAVGDLESDPAGESVVFMLAANPGSAPQPIAKVASGGELARVMLALRLVLTGDPATMVFDEVDAGIGGEAAVAVASALRELGNDHQVIAVTHLAQVAASAHGQFAISKSVKGGKTYGSAVRVAESERAAEIARMLSGGVADESATAHARDLLEKLGGQKKRSQRSS